jgi:hypothetical protein
LATPPGVDEVADDVLGLIGRQAVEVDSTRERGAAKIVAGVEAGVFGAAAGHELNVKGWYPTS